MILLNRPSLQNLVDKKDLVGVEVGVFRGLNARNILESLNIKKLYLIDTWKGKGRSYRGGGLGKPSVRSSKEETEKELKEFKDKIVILSGDSSEVCKNIKDNELNFVYIDANHKYDGVKKDIKNYYPKVKIGGLIAGHDYQSTNVIHAVNEYFGEENIHSNVCLDNVKSYDWWIWKA